MSFFEELKRRNVVRVGIAYAVIGWVLAQVAEFAFQNFGAPEWVLKSFVVALILGLPIALVFAWAFEMTPDGLKRERDVDRGESITRQTGRRLDRVIIGVLAAAVVMLVAREFYFDRAGDAGHEVVATAGGQSIAVLPFVNMSGDADYFADGLSEELLNLLAKIPDLKVTGRTSSFSFKGRNEDLREIGEALGVNHVLEGSVRRSGDRLRITAQLIKVDDGFHVWSETYDREMADIFDFQDDVAGAISRELNLRLTPSAVRSTTNSDAYALYLQALAEFRTDRYTEQDILDRIDRILALDPDFAKAAELKAIAYWNLGANTIDNPTARGRIHDAASAALQLDPDLVIARTLADITVPGVLTWVTEFDAVERAIKQLPDDYALLGMYVYELRMVLYFRESLAVAQRMVDMEPLAPAAHDELARSLIANGQVVDAFASWRKAAELGGDEYLSYIAWGSVIAGDLDAAIEPLEKAWAAMGLDSGEARAFIEGASDPENGKAFLDARIRRGIGEDHSQENINRWYPWYLAFGYLDDFFEIIEPLQAETDTTWTNADTLEGLGMVYTMSGYLAHSEFMQRNRRFSIMDIWDKRGPPDRCSKDSGEWVCE
jgi:TolB-like protein